MEKSYVLNDSRTLKIRPAVEGDADQCISVLESLTAEKIYIMTEEVTDKRREQLVQLIQENDRSQLFAVAQVDQRIVGSMDLRMFSSSHKTDHVRDLGMGIIEGYRSLGIGSAMMDYAINWAKSKGIEKIVLGVFSTNMPAFNLYRKFGFEEEGINKKVAKINGKYVDLINMGLFL